MENEQTLQFIEDYRSHECLWDIHSKSYTKKNQCNDAYADLAKKYSLTEKAVKNKIKSLRSYFAKEHHKVTERKSGAGSDSKYESTWFAYRALLFIADSVTPRQTKDSFTVITSGSTSLGEENEPSEENNKEDDHLSVSDLNNTLVQNYISPTEKNIENNASGSKVSSEPIRTQRNILTKKRKIDENNEAEALKFLKTAATAIAEKDDCTIFGQMVASEIRKLTPRNKAVAKNRIQNIIFNLQLEEMSSQTFVVSQPHFDESSSSGISGHSSHNTSVMSPSVLSSNDATAADNETEVGEFLIFNLDKQNFDKIC